MEAGLIGRCPGVNMNRSRDSPTIHGMSRFADQYTVAKATGECAATGRALEPGEPCIATLCDLPDEDGFERRDYSAEAWERGDRPERLFSYWKTTVPQPNEQRKLLVDDSVLMDLFERLADDDRPHRVAFRFVLGLILMRKRLLKFTGRREEAVEGEAEPREVWLMSPRGSDPDAPAIEMVNPHLTDEDVRELTDQLSEILQGEL